MNWNLPDSMNFEPQRLQPTIENEEEKKKIFGVELGRGKNPFDAALIACNNNTNQALWVSQRWINDPIVLAAKDKYVDNTYAPEEQLDADQFTAMLLKLANEKNASNTFYLLEGKDRVKLLELYGQAKGYLGKNSNISSNNLTFKQINIKLVKPEHKEEKVIEQLHNEDQLLNNKLPLPKLKLVSQKG